MKISTFLLVGAMALVLSTAAAWSDDSAAKFCEAVRQDDPVQIKILALAGADVNGFCPDPTNRNQRRSLLGLAWKEAKRSAFAKLSEMGADPNKSSLESYKYCPKCQWVGETTLMWELLRAQDQESVGVLIEKQPAAFSDQKTRNSVFYVLFGARSGADKPEEEWFADPNWRLIDSLFAVGTVGVDEARRWNNGETLLYRSWKTRDRARMDFLLQKGAKPQLTFETGVAPTGANGNFAKGNGALRALNLYVLGQTDLGHALEWVKMNPRPEMLADVGEYVVPSFDKHSYVIAASAFWMLLSEIEASKFQREVLPAIDEAFGKAIQLKDYLNRAESKRDNTGYHAYWLNAETHSALSWACKQGGYEHVAGFLARGEDPKASYHQYHYESVYHYMVEGGRWNSRVEKDVKQSCGQLASKGYVDAGTAEQKDAYYKILQAVGEVP